MRSETTTAAALAIGTNATDVRWRSRLRRNVGLIWLIWTTSCTSASTAIRLPRRRLDSSPMNKAISTIFASYAPTSFTNGDLLEHCREMHHLCTNCPARFRKQAELDQHRMDYHYYCKDCDQTFPSEASLKAHKLTLSCGLCGERFSTAAEKLQHLHSNHHVCTTCRLAHLHQADFDQHQVDQHFFCKDCDRYFNNRNSIKQVISHPPPTQTSTLLTY